MIADFEITCDNKFLERFQDKRDMHLLSPEMVEKLRTGNDPYSKYGYGRWLYETGPKTKETLRVVRDCIEFAAENGVPDALCILSRLYYYGYYIDRENGIYLLDRKKAQELIVKAKSKGSELARLLICDDEFLTACRLKKSVASVIRKIKWNLKRPGASLLWKEELAWVYEHKGKNDEAIALYEECVKGGLLHVIPSLAWIYFLRGNVAYYESLMEDGIEKGVPACFTLGAEEEYNWNDYDDETRAEIHRKLDANLRRGAELGCYLCVSLLAIFMHKGMMGYERNDIEAMKYARRGMDLGKFECYKLAIDIFWWYSSNMPEEMNLTEEDALMIYLRALRHASFSEGYDILYSDVLKIRKKLEKMGYADELEYWKNWYGVPARYLVDEDDDDSEDEGKTAIDPTVLVIHPSGLVDFVETESRMPSYNKISKLIDADGYDAVHFSNALNKITADCGLKKHVAMYVDKNGVAKDLPDNPTATMLYGNGYEIRGAVVVALEDKKYNTCAFVAEEDIEAVYDAINDFTGGLLTRDTGQDDDGRYDAWS